VIALFFFYAFELFVLGEGVLDIQKLPNISILNEKGHLLLCPWAPKDDDDDDNDDDDDDGRRTTTLKASLSRSQDSLRPNISCTCVQIQQQVRAA
jgi:hypothetical protein